MATNPLKDFTVRFAAGDWIYREGDPGAEMFIVHSGSVQILRVRDGKEQLLTTMERGDFVGEMSVLEGAPRGTCARAAEETELVEITGAIFDRMIRGNIEIAVRMLRKLSGRLQESQRRVEALGAGAGAAVEPEPPAEAVPVPVPAPVQAADRIPADCLAALVHGEGGHIFPIRGAISLIGRFDPVTGTRPEIDLTAFDTSRSVSRRHARVTAEGSALFVSEEVGALNGTFLNGKRLVPGKPEPIRPGDKLALGMVELRMEGKGEG